jgi:hypothetical protein
MTRVWVAVAGGIAMGLCAPRAQAAARGPSHVYVIAVGYNGLPAAAEASLDPLRFADDDALSFADFAASGAQQTHLLTVLDADTQRRLGARAPEVRPPSEAELHRAVGEVQKALESDARDGAESTVYIYYSGHGTDVPGREPALALLDGELTRGRLYDDVLASLPADHVHLFVDACHAEAVVRPRDAQAVIVPTTEEDAARYAIATTLARFPSVGAIVGATRGAQTHEWEMYNGGVFTHELLSALRGAADVDGNGRVEYSEVAAFLAAANGAVADPRARLEPVVRAPSNDPRAAIVDIHARTEDAVLRGPAGAYGLLSVEDETGDRVLDLRAERGYRAHLLVPSARQLYIHSERGEAVVQAAPGATILLDALAFRPEPLASRGAVETALHRGLFATAFGRSYYRGFVDGASDLVPVPLSDDPLTAERDAVDAAPRPSRTAAWVVLGASGAFAVGAAVFGGLALDARSTFEHSPYEREATAAANRYTADSAAFAVSAGCAAVSAAVAIVLLAHPPHAAPTGSAAAGFDPSRLTLHF